MKSIMKSKHVNLKPVTTDSGSSRIKLGNLKLARTKICCHCQLSHLSPIRSELIHGSVKQKKNLLL